MNKPLILGIETSGLLCSIAWYSGGQLALEYNIEKLNAHAEILPKLVQQGCDYLSMSTGEINFVAIASGPGSFTGLRIGMSYAKGLAYGLNIPLIPVSNFELLFSHAPENLFPRLALIDARRGKLYCGIQQSPNTETTETGLKSWQEINYPGNDIRCIVAENTLHLKQANLIIPECSLVAGIRMRAGELCRLAEAEVKGGFATPPDEIEPIYLQAFAGVL